MTIPRYIVVEGCIGVGKSTLVSLLAEQLGARTVYEEFEENPFLPDFYRDPAANAFKTQLFFLLSRFKQQEKLLQQDLFAPGTVADYMFAKDRIFAELTLASNELVLYDELFEVLQARVATPDLVIFLQAELDVIIERITNRGRSYEQDIDPTYLANLVQSYRRFFRSHRETPLLVVDTNDLDFPSRRPDVELTLQAIEQCHEGIHRLDARGLTRDDPQPALPGVS